MIPNPDAAAAARYDQMMTPTGPVSQADAGYREAENPDRACLVCSSADQAGGCAQVEGRIDPNGVCDLFAPMNQGENPDDRVPA